MPHPLTGAPTGAHRTALKPATGHAWSADGFLPCRDRALLSRDAEPCIPPMHAPPPATASTADAMQVQPSNRQQGEWLLPWLPSARTSTTTPTPTRPNTQLNNTTHETPTHRCHTRAQPTKYTSHSCNRQTATTSKRGPHQGLSAAAAQPSLLLGPSLLDDRPKRTLQAANAPRTASLRRLHLQQPTHSQPTTSWAPHSSWCGALLPTTRSCREGQQRRPAGVCLGTHTEQHLWLWADARAALQQEEESTAAGSCTCSAVQCRQAMAGSHHNHHNTCTNSVQAGQLLTGGLDRVKQVGLTAHSPSGNMPCNSQPCTHSLLLLLHTARMMEQHTCTCTRPNGPDAAQAALRQNAHCHPRPGAPRAQTSHLSPVHGPGTHTCCGGRAPSSPACGHRPCGWGHLPHHQHLPGLQSSTADRCWRYNTQKLATQYNHTVPHAPQPQENQCTRPAAEWTGLTRLAAAAPAARTSPRRCSPPGCGGSR